MHIILYFMNFQDPTIKDIKVQIGNYVRLRRKQTGLTQDELGNLLGLSRITIQNLESGKNFTMDTLLKILQHFGLLAELSSQLQPAILDLDGPTSLY